MATTTDATPPPESAAPWPIPGSGVEAPGPTSTAAPDGSGKPVMPAQKAVVVSMVQDKHRLAISYFDPSEDAVRATVQDAWGDDDVVWAVGTFAQQVQCPGLVLLEPHQFSQAVTQAVARCTSGGGGGDGGGGAHASSGPTTASLPPTMCTTGASVDVPKVPSQTTSDGAGQLPAGLKYLPRSRFRFEAGLALLDTLSVCMLNPQADGSAAATTTSATTTAAKRLQFQALIDLSDRTLVRCLAGLLFYLQSPTGRQDGGRPPPAADSMPSTGLCVATLGTFSLGNFMHVSQNTFKALSIFNVDAHPSVMKGSSRGKEGFSLFALLDRTQSAAGHSRLRQWMLRPLLDPAAIARRRSAVGQVMDEKWHNVELVKQLQARLAEMKDLGRCLLRVSRVQATVNDWTAIMRTIRSMNAARALVEAMVTDLRDRRAAAVAAGASSDASSAHTDHRGPVTSALTHVLTVCGPQLVWVEAMLQAVVDWEQSKADGRLSIQPGLDSLLDEYRQTHSGLHAFLTKVAAQELDTYPELASAVVKYLPQIGFLLLVDGGEHPDGTLAHLTDLERQYCVAAGVYYKTPRMKELDKFFGDIASVIIDIEDDIVRQLEAKVLDNKAMLLQCADAFAELDCVQALADAAIDCKFTCPTIVEGRSLYVKGARHPMQEIMVETFVPNDVALAPGEDAGAVGVITGPNGSGKSCYLKSVGLVVYMAHIGSYVPAECAMVSLVDRIFSRVHTVDSATSGRSTFTMDLHQMATMLHYSTPRSLLLVDEFGKGTTSTDGVALLLASILHLLHRSRGGAPKTLVSTHFQELFQPSMLQAECRNVSVYQMRVVVSEEEEEGEPGTDDAGAYTATMVPLFKLQPGRATTSFGLTCAAQGGLPPSILTRAAQVSSKLAAGASVAAVDLNTLVPPT